MAELLALTDPTGKSLDVVDPGKIGCQRYDFRMGHLLDKSLANNPILRMQLEWHPKEGEGGYFRFDRMFRPGFEKFPRCEELTRAQTWQTLIKLRERPNTRMELAFKTTEHFRANHLKWLSPGELQKMKKQGVQRTYLSNLIVVNPRSYSTPLRLALITNHPMKIREDIRVQPQGTTRRESSRPTPQLKCYNDYLRQYATEYPPVEYLHLRSQINLLVSAADIKSAFDGIQTSRHTSLQNLTFFLKDAEGRPTFDNQGCSPRDLMPAMYLTQSYGAKDSPSVWGAVVKSLVDVYRRRGPSDISNEILQFLDKTIKTTVYADDVHCSLCPGDIILYFTNHPQEGAGHSWVLKPPLTQKVIETHIQSLKHLGNLYLAILWKAFIKIFHFSNLHFKKIEVLDPKLRKELNLYNNQFLPVYPQVDLPRPSHESIMAEARIRIVETDSLGPARPVESKDKAFLTQLGRSSFENHTIGLKTQSLVLNKKFPSERAHSLEQFMGFLTDRGGQITRRNLYGLLGAMSDPLGSLLYLAISQMKIACTLFLAGIDTEVSKSKIDWEEPICPKSRNQVLLAVKIYFLTCQDRLPQGIPNHTSESQFILAGFCDASLVLHTTAIFLLTWCYVDGNYNCQVTRVSLKSYINNSRIQSVPFFELTSLMRVSQEMLRMNNYLSQMNILIHPQNILLFSDSTSTILQVRGRAANLSTRAAAMSAKTQLIFHELQINAYENLFFYKQGLVGKPFYADLFSKSLSHLTDQGLKEHIQSLTDYHWMQEHPSQWTHVSRDLVLPMEKTNSLLQDMEVSSEYLGQLQKSLLKVRQMGKFYIFQSPNELPKADPKLNRSRRAVPTETNQQAREKICKLTLEQPKDLHTMVLNIGMQEKVMHNAEFDILLQRKRAMGLKYRSAIRILARCLYFIYRTRRISQLDPLKKDKVKAILSSNYKEAFQENHSWSLCKQMFCGLANSQVKRRSCHAKDPRPHRGHRALQDLPTSAGWITEIFRIQSTCSGRPATARATCNGSYCKGDRVYTRHQHCVSFLDPNPLGSLTFDLPPIPAVLKLRPKHQQVQLLKVTALETHPQQILHKLKAECRLMSLVPWGNKTHPRFFDALAVHVLTCHYRGDKATINQIQTFETTLDGGLICTWLKGREQRTRVPVREDGTKNEAG